jgi:hypothetical protein
MIVDEAPGQERRVAFRLELDSEAITPRELIERRVRHEIAVHDERASDTFLGLVQPIGSSGAGVGRWQVKCPRRIDAEEQVANAWEAFSAGRVLLLVDDAQVDALDEPLTLRPLSEVCFYKLVPLVGG